MNSENLPAKLDLRLPKAQMINMIVFTGELLESLKEGEADMSKEELIGLNRLINIHAKCVQQIEEQRN